MRPSTVGDLLKVNSETRSLPFRISTGLWNSTIPTRPMPKNWCIWGQSTGGRWINCVAWCRKVSRSMNCHLSGLRLTTFAGLAKNKSNDSKGAIADLNSSIALNPYFRRSLLHARTRAFLHRLPKWKPSSIAAALSRLTPNTQRRTMYAASSNTALAMSMAVVSI